VIGDTLQTAAVRGLEEVLCQFDCDTKKGFPAIAGITAVGRKLPLWIVVKRKSPNSLMKFRDSHAQALRQGNLTVVHSPNGSVDEDIAGAYLHWLRRRMPKSGLAVVWDVFAAHRAEPVKKVAVAVGTQLIFVPAGQTPYWQPLDYRIFGNLKGNAKAQFNAAQLRPNPPALNLRWGLRCLLENWKGITQDHAIDAWKRLTGQTKMTGTDFDFFVTLIPFEFQDLKGNWLVMSALRQCPGIWDLGHLEISSLHFARLDRLLHVLHPIFRCKMILFARFQEHCR
jgi:hypothetical protein